MWTAAILAAAYASVPSGMPSPLSNDADTDRPIEMIRVIHEGGCVQPSGAQLVRARATLSTAQSRAAAERNDLTGGTNAAGPDNAGSPQSGSPQGGPRGDGFDGSGLDIVLQVSPAVAAQPLFLAAVERAVLRWERAVRSPVRILYEVDFTSGEPFVAAAQSSVFGNGPYPDVRAALIARAGPDTLDYVSALPESQFPHVGNAGTNSIPIYGDPRAVRKVLGSTDPTDILDPDGTIVFNTDFTFDLDNSDGITPGAIDVESVMLHEIGHTMGFVSGVDSQFIRTTLDLFRFGIDGTDNDPASLADISNPSIRRELRIGVEAAIDTVGAVGGFTEPLRLSTGTAGDGRQASHWKADELLGLDLPIGIMDPTVPLDALAPEFFTRADRLAFRLLGWDIALDAPPPCAADLNADAALDFFDVVAFIAAFSDRDPVGDFNADGLYNFSDVTAYLASFQAGCP